ncbi:RHS domain-containing protein [Delftia sp. NA_296.1]|uniref:RHS domain-containing protein n=1 Tax=Delftia TaxID=80865 RepID=UPI003D0D4A96
MRPDRRPQELTDETGRIVWAASYKVWGQAYQLQYLRIGTDDAAVSTHDQCLLALVYKEHHGKRGFHKSHQRRSLESIFQFKKFSSRRGFLCIWPIL